MRLGHRSKSLRDDRGAAAVEFAIVGGLLFMVLFGTIQFGLTLNRYQGLQAAAREGARLASLPTTTHDEIVQRVRGTVSIINGSSLADGCPTTLANETGCVEVVPAGDQPCNLRSGATVRVTARYRMQIAIPMWGSPAVTLTGVGTFRCE